MNRKKICVITTVSTTLKTFLIKQLQFLTRNHYDVTVICDCDPHFAKGLPDEITYIPVSMNRGIDNLNSIRSILKLYRIFKRENFDLVQYSTPNASLYASIAAKLAKVPVRLYCQWGIRYVGFTGLKRKIFKSIERTICTLSTYIEPDSYGNLYFSYKEKLYNHDKSRVVWNGSADGVDLTKFDINQKQKWRKEIQRKYRIKETDFVFGFAGRLEKDKGINELLAAHSVVYQKHSHVKLLIVGPEDKTSGLDIELYQWAKSCDNIIFTGFTESVEQYMSAMDVFLLPSYREGFGSVVIEAEAMEVPAIVSDIPGPTDAIQKDVTGLAVPKGDGLALAAAMEKLLLNPRLCYLMGKKARKFVVQKFNQKVLWKHLLEDRNRLIGSNEKGELNEKTKNIRNNGYL